MCLVFRIFFLSEKKKKKKDKAVFKFKLFKKKHNPRSLKKKQIPTNMDIFSTYNAPQFMQQDPNVARRIALARSRRTKVRSYTKAEKCQAESFHPFINPITRDIKDSWEPCNKNAVMNDVLCSVHRKMTNQACASGGMAVQKTIVRVPKVAFDRGGCAYPASFIAAALSGKWTTAKTAAAALLSAAGVADKVRLNIPAEMQATFLEAHGK